MEEDIEVTDINVGELEIDIKAIKSSLKELETERDDIQLKCIKAELELSIENILNRLEQLEKENKKLFETCCKYEDTLEHYENKIFDELDDYIKLDEISKLDRIGIKGKKYISKLKIKEKIEELKQQTSTINDKAISKKYSHTQFARECCIGILKELLNK